MKRVLVFGATSAIAEAAARIWATRGERIFLLGRDAVRLAAIADDLKVRGAAETAWAVLDACDFQRHAAVLDAAIDGMGGVDVALLAHGTLPHQQECERSPGSALAAFRTNALGVISLATHIANRMEVQHSGSLAVIGSVAGDRGRQSNYVYGSAKAAVAVFLQGLRNRLHANGVQVLTVKPGFVDTPMTAGFRKGALWASAAEVGAGIVKAIDARADVVYLPGFWRWIMLAVRLVPERLFKRLKS